eukprot:CAMPEP_0174251396 /NCGR_PEP_ID=MMETSP0439-20130205/1231_1 /TAXON_ID=0 /ORGANISM="Stereomyxa ramosa, Strain Chinc5" /LENGTH=223 /DNA_ID=CAMNT_0015331695 /DNA_START=67 /DNA_END=735 /DNA_ORIENTATION=+
MEDEDKKVNSEEEEEEDSGEETAEKGPENSEAIVWPGVLSGPPCEVLYCGVCGLPPEYCVNGPDFEACKPWLKENCPDMYPDIDSMGSTDKGKRKRGGKGQPKKGAKKEDTSETVVGITRSQRGRRKWVTSVSGLEELGICHKDASQLFRRKLGVGATINKKEGTIDIQGDVKNEIMALIQKQDWGISPSQVQFLGEGKKVKSGRGNARSKSAQSRNAKASAF